MRKIICDLDGAHAGLYAVQSILQLILDRYDANADADEHLLIEGALCGLDDLLTYTLNTIETAVDAAYDATSDKRDSARDLLDAIRKAG